MPLATVHESSQRTVAAAFSSGSVSEHQYQTSFARGFA